MKITITAIVLALSPMAVTAEAASCEEIGDLAGTIMKARQDGVAMSAMMEITASSELSTKFVVMAYGKSRWSSPAMKTREVQDFRNNVELGCYTAQGADQ